MEKGLEASTDESPPKTGGNETCAIPDSASAAPAVTVKLPEWVPAGL